MNIRLVPAPSAVRLGSQRGSEQRHFESADKLPTRASGIQVVPICSCASCKTTLHTHLHTHKQLHTVCPCRGLQAGGRAHREASDVEVWQVWPHRQGQQAAHHRDAVGPLKLEAQQGGTQPAPLGADGALRLVDGGLGGMGPLFLKAKQSAFSSL
jgi:hypothetical protein